MTTKTLTSQHGLGVVTVNTAKPPDTRDIHPKVKLFRNSYEKGYDNVNYLLGYKPIPKSASIAASKEAPPQSQTSDDNAMFTKLRHDYQDPDRDKLQTAKTKQLPIDDYFKVIGREKEVADFTNKVEVAKYNKPTPNVTARINKQEEMFIKQMQNSNRNSPIVRGYVGKKKIQK